MKHTWGSKMRNETKKEDESEGRTGKGRQTQEKSNNLEFNRIAMKRREENE